MEKIFPRQSIPDIEDLFENQFKKKITILQNELLFKKLLNEITKMKKKWVRLQGGHQRDQFLKMLETQSIKFEFYEECEEISSGNNFLFTFW
jgi:hypothetical protein